jgi:NADH dehydrogenase (ubiquinone) 1 alpha subcomplex subunit 9
LSLKTIASAPKHAAAGYVGVQKCLYSSEPEVKPLKTTKLSALKRGTGGRSSFSGIVATVFGASGFLGKYVVNKLGKKGTQVIIPYRGDEYENVRMKLMGDLGQIIFYPYHLKDEQQLYKAMKYSNVVINLTGREFETRNFSLDDVHVKGARNIARIAKDVGVERLVHISALNASDNPTPYLLKKGSEFMRTKFRGEMAVREEFPEAIIFRPADIHGMEDRFFRYYAGMFRQQYRWLPLYNKGVGIVKQPVFVSDVAQAIINSISDPDAVGKTYQAVGPRRYDLAELVDYFYRIMRKGDEWGYKRTNIKYDPIFWAKVAVIDRVCPIWTGISWERLERECFTDTVDPKLPTLEDLGVNLTLLEDRAEFQLHSYRAFAYHEEELGEFPKPTPPPFMPAT